MHQGISLLDLSLTVKNLLEEQLEPSYWVVAEIGELKEAANGHAYLDLVEKQGNQVLAKMRANIWSYSYRMIASRFRAVTGQPLRQGMKILCQAVVTFHEVYGFSLNIKDIDPDFTLGERARIRQEIIDRLVQEGLMDLNKKKTLPLVPQRIAVISSITAAGYGDFVNQLDHNREGYRIHFRLFQATLQGSEAAKSIIAAIDQVLNTHEYKSFDALVLIRGGGAQMDLDCFDDEALARALAKFPIPVLTGIGHERDETIADMVAHTKMKTPTAVAEFLLSGFRDFEDSLALQIKNLQRNVGWQILEGQRNLRELESQLKGQVKFSVNKEKDKLAFLMHQTKNLSLPITKLNQLKVTNAQQALHKSWKRRLEMEQKGLMALEKLLTLSNPQTFFTKGYTRTEIDGKPLHLCTPEIGQEMQTFSQNQTISSTIQKIENHGK
jgi:exodeoxyribonuclease VII large subunit